MALFAVIRSRRWSCVALASFGIIVTAYEDVPVGHGMSAVERY